MDASNLRRFVTFINDYSQYMYLYLLSFKNEVLNTFRVFKDEIELQWEKQLESVRLDKGGEHCGRYIMSEQEPGPFAKFL